MTIRNQKTILISSPDDSSDSEEVKPTSNNNPPLDDSWSDDSSESEAVEPTSNNNPPTDDTSSDDTSSDGSSSDDSSSEDSSSDDSSSDDSSSSSDDSSSDDSSSDDSSSDDSSDSEAVKTTSKNYPPLTPLKKKRSIEETNNNPKPAEKKIKISNNQEPEVEAVEEENRNPNVKTSNNNEPAEKKPPTSTIPEPLHLVDSSLMAAETAADVKEYRESYVLEMDMAGLKSGEIKVEVEDDNVVVISGKRKREEGVKYLRMERRVGNLMRKFVLPENANIDTISAVCQDGLLSVIVHKKLPVLQPSKTRRVIVL